MGVRDGAHVSSEDLHSRDSPCCFEFHQGVHYEVAHSPSACNSKDLIARHFAIPVEDEVQMRVAAVDSRPAFIMRMRCTPISSHRE